MRSKIAQLFPILVALVILTVGARLRFHNLKWDADAHLHPDERYLTMVVSTVRFPGEEGGECQSLLACLNLYWRTEASPLNPANYAQYANYVYGTLPLFAARAAARWLDRACLADSAPAASLIVRMLFDEPAACSIGHYTGYGGIHLVGRALSALADLVTLIGLMAGAGVLYGRRISILAGGLYAVAVLPVQHAHFFVVDSFATVFVIWTLFFCVLSQRKRNPLYLLPAGFLTGLAVASKISVWPLALIVAIAGFAQLMLENGKSAMGGDLAPDGNDTEGAVPRHSLGVYIALRLLFALVLSGVLAVVAFRVGQPYAFAGPGFLDVKINPAWMATMRETHALMRGLRDVPYGHQWASRLPLVFPWRNMVLWGMGLPLGLAAWGGWFCIGWRIVRRRHWQHLVPWVWGTLFFLYQGTQWVKSMRYLLPVYPVFSIFAAWGLIHFVDATSIKQRKSRHHWFTSLCRTAGALAIPVVLGGTILWAIAFMSIYTQSVSRVEASRWMYHHIPTTLQVQTTTGERLNVALSPGVILTSDADSVSGIWASQEAAVIDAVVLPRVSSLGGAGFRQLTVTIADSIGRVTVDLPAPGSVGVAGDTVELVLPLDHPRSVEDGDTVNITVTLVEGDPVRLQTSVIANEHWDDGLPLRLDGRDAFWNWYQGLSSSPTGQMNNYDNDTVEKRLALLAELNEADYIVLSSNRLYASIPRLPQRYPMTTEYYRLLFNGALGFELAAEFVSYPTLGPCQFPDQETPFPLVEPVDTNARPCSIILPPAEEAFSVYDHPTVLIFRKTAAYSRDRAEVLLPVSLLDDVRWMTPREATFGGGKDERDGDSLLMSSRMRLEQEEGGTWSSLFDVQAIQNAVPAVGALLWALMLTVIGWIAFPLVYIVLPNLRYRGYGISRVLGLLIWVYVGWLLASLHVLPHTRGVLALLLLLLFIISAWAAYVHRIGLKALVMQNWRHLLTMDLVFLGLYLLWVGVRWMNPDLWHLSMGGEKPMDFAYLNAVIKSTWFPPYDPWFAGGQLNYYYFGFVIVGSLTELLGIVPSIAYNLAIPSLFALTGLGAYTLADTLAGGGGQRGRRAGLLAVLFVVIIGNLGELQMLYKGFVQVGGISFESLIPGYPDLVSALVGLWKVVVQGASLPFRPEWWYWNATRIIPILDGEVGPINEFPVFTFLYGDLHAHAMALPLTGAALAFALQWAIGASRFCMADDKREHWWHRLRRLLTVALPHPAGSLLFAGLVAGSLRATNTWDYPTYLVLMTVGFFTGAIVREFGSLKTNPDHYDRKSSIWRLLAGLLTPISLLVIAELLFRPFVSAYEGAYAAFELWNGSRTPLPIYLLMYGMFVFPIVVAAVVRLARVFARRRTMSEILDAVLWPFAILMVVLVLLTLLLGYFRVSIAWLAVPLGGATLLLLADPETPLMRRLLWFWTGSALALSLLVEVAVLKGDIGRMNTVFKFHLQVWMLLALTATIFVERLIFGSGTLSERLLDAAPCATPLDDDSRRESDAANSSGLLLVAWQWPDGLKEIVRGVVSAVTVILVALAALYPIFAIPGRMRDRWVLSAPHTLDGMAYIAYAKQYERGVEIPLAADYEVIRWLQANVEGSPTIIEAQADREYLWGNRISTYTGLPSVVGWRWHQVQQRMVMPSGTVEGRQHDVRLFYNTSDPHVAHEILTRYDVSYVILTPYERAYMLSESMPKFEDMVDYGWLEVAYRSVDATIYRVVK